MGRETAGLPATGEEPGFNWEEEMDKPLRWFSKLAMMLLPCDFELKNWPFRGFPWKPLQFSSDP